MSRYSKNFPGKDMHWNDFLNKKAVLNIGIVLNAVLHIISHNFSGWKAKYHSMTILKIDNFRVYPELADLSFVTTY